MRDRNLPLYASYVMKNHANLFSDALVCSLALRPLHLFECLCLLNGFVHHADARLLNVSRDFLIGDEGRYLAQAKSNDKIPLGRWQCHQLFRDQFFFRFGSIIWSNTQLEPS